MLCCLLLRRRYGPLPPNSRFVLVSPKLIPSMLEKIEVSDLSLYRMEQRSKVDNPIQILSYPTSWFTVRYIRMIWDFCRTRTYVIHTTNLESYAYMYPFAPLRFFFFFFFSKKLWRRCSSPRFMTFFLCFLCPLQIILSISPKPKISSRRYVSLAMCM